MKYVAYIRWDDSVISGEGDTPEAARADCARELQKIMAELAERTEVRICLGEHFTVPLSTPIPTRMPPGMGLLVMIRVSHNDGEAYEWRVFAVPHGTFALGRAGDVESDEYVIGETPVYHSFLDSNSDYEYPLPTGSMEFIEGDWYACSAAAYDY